MEELLTVAAFKLPCKGKQGKKSNTTLFRPNSASRSTLENREARSETRSSWEQAIPTRHKERTDLGKGRNAHERPGVAFQPIVVPRPVQKTFHFLHIGLPVNLCV